MKQDAATRPIVRAAIGKRKPGPLKAVWKRVRQPLARSRLVTALLTELLAFYLRLVKWTTRTAPGSPDISGYVKLEPAIGTIWHGQHLLCPVLNPSTCPVVGLVSRSADAELNAMVLERLGWETVRGSGGRENKRRVDKGGARALLALKKALDNGKNVGMIADIPNGTPRDSGMGIVLLARISGRPIVGMVMATSRRKVLERTWDKMVINLPFGRRAVVMTEPIYVPADADENEMERKRQDVTAALNAATGQAYALVDGVR